MISGRKVFVGFTYITGITAHTDKLMGPYALFTKEMLI